MATVHPPPLGNEEEKTPREFLEGDPDIQEIIDVEFRRRQDPKATIEATPIQGVIGPLPQISADLPATGSGFCLDAVRDRDGNQVEKWGQGGAVLRPGGADPGNKPGERDGVYEGVIEGVPPAADGNPPRIQIRPLNWSGQVKEERVKGGPFSYIPPCSSDPRVFALHVQNGESQSPNGIGFFTTPGGAQGITYYDWVILDRDPPDEKLDRSWDELANDLNLDYDVPSGGGWRQWSDRNAIAVMATDRFTISWPPRYPLEEVSDFFGSRSVLEDLEAIMANLNVSPQPGSDLKLGITITDIERLTEAVAGNPSGSVFTDPTPASSEVAQTAQNVVQGLVDQGILTEVERVEVLKGPGPSPTYGPRDGAALATPDYGSWSMYNPAPVQDATPIPTAQNMILDVPAMAPCGRQCANPADTELKPVPGGGLHPSISDSPLVLIESLGGSTGQVFRVFAIGGGMPALPSEQGVVLEPIALPERAKRRLREAAEGAPAEVWNAYCLELLRQVPIAGMIYRIAGPAEQRGAEPFRSIPAAARSLRDEGALHPDSEAESYFHSILQWAIWSREQGFDEPSFTHAFLEHTEESFRRSGAAWNSDVERAVRGYAAGRWRDIQAVLREAGS